MKIIGLIIGFYLTSLSAFANNKVVELSLDYNNLQDTTISKSNNSVFHYKFNDTNIDFSFKSNGNTLAQLDKIFADTNLSPNIDTLKITITSSPDGKYDYNLGLANSRLVSLKSTLNNRYPLINNVNFITKSYVNDWSMLKELIKQDFDLPWWGAVMEILDEDLEPGAKGWKLKKVGEGESWQYIIEKYIHHLRACDVKIETIYKKTTQTTLDANLTEILPKDTLKIDNYIKYTPLLKSVEQTQIDNDIKQTSISRNSATKVKKDQKEILALKTNLLFDALTLVNFEVEVPIGNRWSIAGECVFPWWTNDNGKSDSKRNRLQILNVNLEARYWFGNRDKRERMTGWFAGVYGGAGIYDIESNGNGYQGEFFIMGGLSGGFAHTINKKRNLRIEYSLGIGYMKTDYRNYTSHFAPTNGWHAIQNMNGRYTWIGPTKVKVSLVWMLNKKGKR